VCVCVYVCISRTMMITELFWFILRYYIGLFVIYCVRYALSFLLFISDIFKFSLPRVFFLLFLFCAARACVKVASTAIEDAKGVSESLGR